MINVSKDGVRPPIIQYWHSAEVPTEISELVSTFRDQNPTMRHLLFNETEAMALIAEHYTDREVAAFRACAVPAMQADYFRYCAILALGGIYADADFRCRQPLHSLVEQFNGECLFTGSRGQIMNGFFLLQKPHHPLLRLTLDIATHNIEQRFSERIWLVTGPGIFNGLAILYKRGFSDTAKGDRCMGVRWSALEAAGGYVRIAEAFNALHTAPLRQVADWISGPEFPLKHRQDHTHWFERQKQKTIFR
ncbi:MAG: glycosyltransferase [Solirubrobacterales bacterium]